MKKQKPDITSFSGSGLPLMGPTSTDPRSLLVVDPNTGAVIAR